ncbi:MAG: ABC transporter ATP-binding protein [Victivallaceae bacterium]|nr:ABC transporter ATP-binding protein [Victivallaceae bacterium]
MLEIRNLTRRFGKKTVLDGISFSVPENTVWGIVGANGAGKTTLLRTVSGLDEADGGDVLWRGKSLLMRRDLPLDTAALMPDRLADAPDLTVAEYLDFYARAEFSDAHAAETAEKNARICGGVQDEWNDLFLADLSRGMKQRVSLARMLILSPAVLLFDEPGAGLDPHALADLRALLPRLASEGHTVVVSSHLLGELSEIADGATFLENGAVVCSGRKEDLFEKYTVRNMEALYLKIMRKGF